MATTCSVNREPSQTVWLGSISGLRHPQGHQPPGGQTVGILKENSARLGGAPEDTKLFLLPASQTELYRLLIIDKLKY
jgi:hypothetical protein